jgi:hypothetical protein
LKIPPTRGIFELVDSLSELINTLKCPCGGSISTEYASTGCNISAIVRCLGKKCGINYQTGHQITSLNTHQEKNRNRLSDYALSVLFVLAHISSGDGGTEAQRLISFLDLPGGPSMMKKSTFPTLEKQIQPSISSAADAALFQVITEEVRLSFGDNNNEAFNTWKHAVDHGHELTISSYPSIFFVAMDMGWNKRSSGRRYDSLSGHAFLVGRHTRKALTKAIISQVRR